MVYLKDTASDISDLLSRLSTFLVSTAGGWTDRALTTGGSVGLAKTGAPDQIEVQFRYDTGSPDSIGIYQSLDFDAVGTAPGSHTDDSGQGNISGTDATIALGRHVNVVDSSMPFWFFEDDDYCYCAVQVNAGPPIQMVHFGFGNVIKRGTYTGGAFAYGWKRDPVSSTPLSDEMSILLDGQLGTADQEWAATLHAEGLQNMGGSDKWCLVSGSSGSLGTDRGANTRHFVQGGYRAGLSARFFGRESAQSLAGNIPLYSIDLFYRDNVPSPDEVFPIGTMPDVFGFNIEHFNAGDEIDVGGDTYVVFPSWRNNVPSSNTTDFQGIAYKKVTS